METFKFGQPEGRVCQLGFVVEDVRTAIGYFTKAVGAGPWLLVDPVEVKNGLYRGRPFDFRGCGALGNAGHMQIELIQQADDTPSIYTELIAVQGFGLHHQGVAVRDFDGELERYKQLGYEVAYTCQPRARIAMLDSKGKLPFFVELLEMTDQLEATYDAVYRASIDWDGTNPIRDPQSFLAPAKA